MPFDETPFHTNQISRGFNFGESKLARGLEEYAAYGSANALWLGKGYFQPFRGVLSKGASTGSRVMKPIGETWGGIKDVGGTVAAGSVSEEVNRSLWGIGAGQVHREGTDITGFTLSTLLKLVLRSGGAYGTPFTAGLAVPSTPSVGVLALSGDVDGAVSFKIERYRPSTGGISVASLTSEVIVPAGNKVRVTFPTAISGQTHWRLFATLQRFGGQGIHYALPYNGSIDITETDVAAGTVDGIARSLILDWKDGDLVPIEASFDDYSPQAATHHLRLENIMCLPGSYADASGAVSSTNTGSAIQVSKENNYESYNPTHLLFLPERVVDTLSRPIDSHGFVACENSIHAIHYVGPREDLPSCTLTTILQDQGIQYPHNWCHFRGRLAVITAEGNWLLMSEDGSIDTEWTAPVRRYIRDWALIDTAIGYDGKNDCLVIFNGREALAYSLQNGDWSLPIYLQDYGITAGSVQSCQSAGRRLVVTIKNGSAFTAYEWDTGATTIPLSFVHHYTGRPNAGALKNIYALSTAIETNLPGPIVIAVNTNLEPVALRGVSVSFGLAEIDDALGRFRPEMDGKRIAVFADGISGGAFMSDDYAVGYIEYVSATQIRIVNVAGNDIESQISRSGVLCYIGDYVEEIDVDATGAEHIPDLSLNVIDAKSFASAVWFQANDNVGSVLETHFYGGMSPSGRL